MRSINLNRQLVGIEDLLIGFGTVMQTRGGQQTLVTKINAGSLPFDETRTLLQLVQSINVEALGSMITELQALYTSLDNINLVANGLDTIVEKLNISDYTAESVLQRLLTVDGSGSNIDADLLDGQEGAYYLNASNINTGTINDSYLPDTITSDIAGNAATSTKLATARTIALTGDVTGNVSFDGSANVSITTTVADDSHNHVISNVDGLQAALDSKSPLASPTFTGVPTAPTAAVNTNTTQLATTAFVNAEIANDAVPRVTSTDNAIVRFDGTTGAVQASGVFINDIDVYDAANFGLSISSLAGGKNSIYSYLDASTLEFYSGVTQKTGIVINGQTAVGGSKITFRAGGNESGAIDNTGNLLLTSGTGALGYGAGAGGTVAQLTSKSTAVTLNKPSGQITMSNGALAAGATAIFVVNNSLVGITSNIIANVRAGHTEGVYELDVEKIANGSFTLRLTNKSASTYAQSVVLKFDIIAGATS